MSNTPPGKLFAFLTAFSFPVLLMSFAALAGVGIFIIGEGIWEAREEHSEAEFTAEEVARHNTTEDCWLIVYGKVFDLTEASKAHPGTFNCGGDGSENYRKNHGEKLRDKMMAFYIGELKGDPPVPPQAEVEEEINPRKELFVEEGSWDPLNLMIVMERENRSLLAIDARTHTPVGRVLDVGERVHTQVFSPDGNYAYHISRDGWLTKIDLRTLDPVGHVRVGENSRGTALTENGKIVAVGNYEPRNVVLLDADTLEIIKRIDLFDYEQGKLVKSRAGAMVEKGNKIIVALKDTASIWVIDTDVRGMPVMNYYWDIGDDADILHDGYLTADGRYYLISMQESNQVWVLDTDTMEPIATVSTGKKPHTGPGATWGDATFVPALDEGLITAIDMKTWTPKKFIKTGGPGLFVRSYPDSSYPYVWADTAFGENEDEIYVIDGKSLEVVKTLVPMEGKRSIHPEFTPDGRYVYVAVWLGNKVYVYDSRTFEVVKTIDAITPSGVSSVGLRVEEPGI